MFTDANLGFFSGAYTPNALNFYNGGSGNNSLTRASALVGASDSYVGALSFWVYTGANGTAFTLFNSTAGSNAGVIIIKNASNGLAVQLWNAAGTLIMQSTSSNNSILTGSWYHVLASWNTNFGAGSKIEQLYINEVSNGTIANDTGVAAQVGMSIMQPSIPVSTSNQNVVISEFWFANSFVDFSVAGNRNKFSLNSNPIFLGATGQLPTGSSSLIYLNNPAATAGTNKGTGGNFTINGNISNFTPIP